MRSVHGPVIARIPIISRVPADVDFAPTRSPDWKGLPHKHDAPLYITHRVGGVSPAESSRQLANEGESGVYYLDVGGELAYSGHIGGGATRQAMRTGTAGHEYEVAYETGADLNRWEWVWRRSIFMFALAARRRGLAAHGCVFTLADGRAVLCPGVSGTGKSTLARMLGDDAALGVTVLCDDRAAVTEEAGGLWLWSTPWYSRAAAANEGDGPFAAVILPRRGHQPTLRAAERRIVARELMRTLAYPFWSPPLTTFALGMVDAIIDRIPAFEFSYTPSSAAGRTLVDSLIAELSLSSTAARAHIHSA